MKVKRRELLLASLATAAVAQDKPEQPLEQARNGMKANQNALDKVKLPMSTEPAFVFKA